MVRLALLGMSAEGRVHRRLGSVAPARQTVGQRLRAVRRPGTVDAAGDVTCAGTRQADTLALGALRRAADDGRLEAAFANALPGALFTTAGDAGAPLLVAVSSLRTAGRAANVDTTFQKDLAGRALGHRDGTFRHTGVVALVGSAARASRAHGAARIHGLTPAERIVSEGGVGQVGAVSACRQGLLPVG